MNEEERREFIKVSESIPGMVELLYEGGFRFDYSHTTEEGIPYIKFEGRVYHVH